MLKKKDADPHAANENGTTLLHYAAMQGMRLVPPGTTWLRPSSLRHRPLGGYKDQPVSRPPQYFV